MLAQGIMVAYFFHINDAGFGVAMSIVLGINLILSTVKLGLAIYEKM